MNRKIKDKANLSSINNENGSTQSKQELNSSELLSSDRKLLSSDSEIIKVVDDSKTPGLKGAKQVK